MARVTRTTEVNFSAGDESPRASSTGGRPRPAERTGLLATWARIKPQSVAIQSAHGNRSFLQLEANSCRLARALAERGIGPNDGLALLCANRPEFVEVMFAAERAGIRVTPVMLDLTVREAEYLIKDCQAKAVIVDSSVHEGLREMISRNDGLTARISIGAAIPGMETYEAVLAAASAQPFTADSIGIPMYYTSGTTGLPKGVYRREPILPATMSIFTDQVKLASNRDIALAPLSLFRSGVFNLSVRLPLLSGVGIILVDERDPEAILGLIARHRITYAYLAPFLFHRLIQSFDSLRGRFDLTSLRHVLHTGAPCPAHIKHRLIEWFGPIITECYAGTEGGYTVISSDDWLNKPGSVGRTNKLVVILSDDGDALPTGQIGQVYLRAPATGRFEYFNSPEKTRSAYRGDWFTMGDYGYVDADDYLYLTGRSAEIINVGGLKAYPAEIDSILSQHPAVADAAAFGAPNLELVEEVHAIVQLHPGNNPDETLISCLDRHCRSSLAAYKCPRKFEFVDEVPRLPTGKIRRELIRHQRQ